MSKAECDYLGKCPYGGSENSNSMYFCRDHCGIGVDENEEECNLEENEMTNNSETNLSKLDTIDLINELEKRKSIEVPKLIDQINNNLKVLKGLGVVFYDAEMSDYILSSVDQYSSGNLYFHTKEL